MSRIESKRSKSDRKVIPLRNNPAQSYEFRLTTNSQVTASAGGVIATVITCDPTSFAEFSDIGGLFSEIRLKSSTIHVMDALRVGPTVNDAIGSGSIPCGFDPANTSTAPTSAATVWSVAGARVKQLSPNGAAPYFTMQQRLPPLEWAAMTAPAPGPYAGCYGAWVLYRSGVTASQTYLDIWVENVYEVRGRR